MKLAPQPSGVYFTPLAGLALVAACLLAEGAVLRVGMDDLDEGYFVQQAVRVMHGHIPYRDFQTLYTPGLLYVHAALFGVLGGPYLLAPRSLALLARAATAVLLYALATPVVRRPLLAAAPAVVLLLGFDDAPVRWEPHPGWLSAFFALLAAWCVAHASTRRRLIGSGLAAGASYLFKQNTGIFILAAIVVHGLLPSWFSVARGPLPDDDPPGLSVSTRSRRERMTARVSPGGRLEGSAVVAPSRLRAVGLPVVGFVAFTAVWLAPLLVALRGDFSLLGGFVGGVNQTGLFSPPELPVVVPLLCLAGGVWRVRHSRDTRLSWYLLAGAALFLTEYPRMDTLHLAWSAPLLLVVGSVVVDHLRRLAALTVALGVLLVCLPTLSSRVDFVRQATTPMTDVPFANGLLLPQATATELRQAVFDIQQRTQPGEPIFVYPTSPLLYVLADRPNPTRFDHLNPGAADSRQIEQVLADLSASHVKLVVVSEFWVSVWGPAGPNTPVLDWIGAHASQVARYGTYRVLAASL